MTYTAWEIILFLLLAFLLGAFLVYIWMHQSKDGGGSSAADQDTIASLRAELAKTKQTTRRNDAKKPSAEEKA